MSEFVQDPQFGEIVDFDYLRIPLREAYDAMLPDFDMMGAILAGSRHFNDEPSQMIAGGASMLAWMMLPASDEPEIAEELKDSIFTLGWTEEHTGSDLLSIKTQATPKSDDPDEKEFHIKGGKWLINNSYHADYHMVLAKIDPTQNGPRSLSLFLVPRSSTKNWQRLETHVLTKMVLTKFDIDGPGRLVGKKGYGLTIVQRMAAAARYQCSYVGMRLLHHAIPATLHHLSTKEIFEERPINFSNVFRQMYNLTLQSAFLTFVMHRAVAYSDSSFLQFHGTMLKSWLLLRVNEVLSQNWLVAGSKGFLKESVIGGMAIDSFVLPVFDGHYTINTLMTAKHMSRYLDSDHEESVEDRVNYMRQKLFVFEAGNQINAKSSDIRRPEFFNYAAYMKQLEIPLNIDVPAYLERVKQLLAELDELGISGEAEYKYKVGTLVHWLESVLAAAEFWKVMGDDLYLNVIVQQYNAFVHAFNEIISEGALQTPFLTPLRQVPLPEVSDNEAFLRELMDIESKIEAMRVPAAGD